MLFTYAAQKSERRLKRAGAPSCAGPWYGLARRRPRPPFDGAVVDADVVDKAGPTGPPSAEQARTGPRRGFADNEPRRRGNT
jgi:hypothetical protein